MERYPDSELKPLNLRFRNLLENSPAAHTILKFVAVFGVCLMVADGILIPAQSVLGAIEGLRVAKPDLPSSTIIGVSCAILVLVFLIQWAGTARIGSLFAPVVIIWLLLNFVSGIYNLAKHDHSVLKAFSPYFAGRYLVRRKTEGWKSLGGILLAFTGVEAMYANLGALSMRAIQISWLVFGYPCLLFAYIGQAAYISHNPSKYTHSFFSALPPGMYWPGTVISIFAAAVASQALITGTFQLISQVVKLSYFPKVKVIHTSSTFHGQIYIPLANWLLMLGTVIVTAVYNNTTRLGKAYGTCVALIVFTTTCMVSIVAIIAWRIDPLIVLPVFIIFASLDGLYLSSALTKVPDGAWFTLMLAILLSGVTFVWRYGKERQWRADSLDRIPLGRLLTVEEGGKLCLNTENGRVELLTLKGVGIFFEKKHPNSGETSTTVFTRFLRKFQARHELTIFFYSIPLPKPKVDPEEEYSISRSNNMPNCYQVTIRHGFNELGIRPDLGPLIRDRLRDYITRNIRHGVENRVSDNFQESDITALDDAFAAQVIYIIGKEQLNVASESRFIPLYALKIFIWLRGLSGSNIAEMSLNLDDIFEMGSVKAI